MKWGADKVEYAAFCIGCGCASLALGVIVAQFFAASWRVSVGVAVTLTSAALFGWYAAGLFDRLKRKEVEADLPTVEVFDRYILHYTEVLMDSEHLLDDLQNQLGDTDGIRDLFTLLRTIGQLEGAVESFHHIVGAGFGPQLSRALMDPITVKLDEVLAACAPFEPKE